MSFTFYYPTKAEPTTTVTLPSPERGNTEQRTTGQAVGETRGGDVYAYQRAIARVDDTYTWTELTATEKAAVDSLVADDLNGAENTFEFDDHHGNSWTGRLMAPDLQWANTAEDEPGGDSGIYGVTLSIRKSS